MLDLNALKMFVMVAKNGSLSATAKNNNIALPTLSRKIAELESSMRVQLLERTSKGCRVTDAGKRLLDQTSYAIEILQDAEQSKNIGKTQLIGRLRLSLPQSFGPWWEILGKFQQEYPDVVVSVHSTERRIDLISEGVDAALRVGTIADDTLIARHLINFRHILVASPELIATLPELQTPIDLLKCPCAAWGSTLETHPIWMLGQKSYNIPAIFTVNDYLHLRTRALAGNFITELPSFLAAKHIETGELVELLKDYPFPYSALHLVYKKQHHQSAVVGAYIKFCMKHISILSEACQI